MTIELYPHDFFYVYAFIVLYVFYGLLYFRSEKFIDFFKDSGITFRSFPVMYLSCLFMVIFCWPLLWIKYYLTKEK